MADNVVEIIIRAIDQMSGTLDKIGKSGGDLQTKLVANWKAIGLAAAAAGASLELLARQQGELSRQTDQAAITTGMTSAEVNQLARDVADASTSIEEALDLISLAGKEGLKSGEEIKAYAEFWDMVSDASGEAAEELAGASDGLEHFGISAKNSSEAADAFGHILNNTKTSISEFLGIANKVGPSLDKFDLSINDLALMVDQLEEAGYTGKQAIKAINEAAAGAGSFEAFVSNLEKATGAQIDFNRSLSGSAEKLAAQAAAVDKNVTPIQRLTSAWNEFMYSNGRFIQQAAVMVPALASVGPLLAGLESLSLASSVSIAGMTVTVGGLLTVLGPLAIALAGVAAVWILNKDNVDAAMESYKGGTSAIKEMDQAARDAIPSLRKYADAQKEAAEAGKDIENVFKYSTKTVYEYGGAYTAVHDEIGTTAQLIAQAEREMLDSKETTSKGVVAATEQEIQAHEKVIKEYESLGYSVGQAESLVAKANALMQEGTVGSAEAQIDALNKVAEAWMSLGGVAGAVSGDAMDAYKRAMSIKGQEVLSGKNPEITTLNFTGKNGLPAGYNEVAYLDQNAYSDYWTDSTGKQHWNNYDLMTSDQQWRMAINQRGWRLEKKNDDGEWRPWSGVSGGTNAFGTKHFMEALAIFVEDEKRQAALQKKIAAETAAAQQESSKATEQSTQTTEQLTQKVIQDTEATQQNVQATQGSTDATLVHRDSIFDMMRKYQESDSALGKSRGTLDHWNTEVVGNTDEMSKETLGSVEGMSSGVRAGAGRTTRDISETWNQIGKDSEEGTAGLGNDWKSFLQSARRDLQTEVQACSGPGCGFTGGGTGDGTGTGLEPVYDLEELWRRRGLPRAARGAKIVGAGDILVGEERPEVVRLPQGASVHPLSEYDGGFGGRAGNVYQITINTQGVIGDKSTARQFARWIMEALDFETIRRGTVA